jgi:hypothetical protein
VFDLCRQRLYVCFWFEPIGDDILKYVGEDNQLWETDFPHPTCIFPNPLGLAAKMLKDLPASVVRKVMQDNAVDLYSLELPSPVAT